MSTDNCTHQGWEPLEDVCTHCAKDLAFYAKWAIKALKRIKVENLSHEPHCGINKCKFKSTKCCQCTCMIEWITEALDLLEP